METLSGLVSMKGRRVIITGAAAGIGKAMAIRFAEAGAGLVLLDRREQALLSAAKESCVFSPDVTTQVLDLARKENVDIFWERLNEPPDTLINNAGVYPMKDYLAIDEKFLKKVLSVNLESVFWMSQKFIERRKDKGGVIINVSSIEALLPFKDALAAYSVSKAGVLALTRALARDYGRRGFRVNAILPGAIRTPGTRELVKKAVQKVSLRLFKAGYDFQSRLALGRWGKPDEVARVALFLACDLSSYVQGAMIPVDGGFLSS